MQSFNSTIKPLSVVPIVLTVWLSLWGLHAAVGQEKQTAPPAKPDASREIAVGAEVVLKDFRTSLDDDGRQVSSWGQKRFWIEQIDGDRVRITSRDKMKRGWVRRDQVLLSSQAIDFFTAEIAKDQNNTDALWSRAQLWAEPKDDDRALADYDHLIRLLPDYAPSYVARSKIASRKGRIDQALADLNKAIALNPKDSASYRDRAGLCIRKRDYKRAIADFDQALRIDPTDAFAWSFRSRCWLSEGNLERALKDIDEAIRLAPTLNFFYTNRGNVRKMKKDYDGALLELSKWNDALCLDTLAAAYAETGDFAAAIQWETKAIELMKADQSNPSSTDDFRTGDRLRLYQKGQPYRE